MKRLTIHMLHWTAKIMDIVQEKNLPSPDLSPKISTLEDLRTTKLATNKATNILEGFTRVIFNFILYESLWTRNMKYQYEIQ